MNENGQPMISGNVHAEALDDHSRSATCSYDEQLLVWLYAEFAEEDGQLTVMGLADYVKALR
jgi:hypothetical protein